MQQSDKWKLSPAVLRELDLVPSRHRSDARAEAHLAMGEGRDPKCAIQSYLRAALRAENRP